MEDIAGKVVFITGGAQGIGLGMAQAFAAAGARIALVDLHAEALDAARAELSPVTDVETYVLDVRDRDAFAKAADAAEARLGPVAILCNNAGVAGAFSLREMSYELWDLVLGVNLVGAVNGVQTFLPRMLARGAAGHVVNTAAGAGLAAGAGVSGYMYQTSKYAVVGMTESLDAQFRVGKLPLGATVLCPGPVPTNIAATTFAALPESARRPTPEEQASRDERVALMNAYLAQGVPPRTVGDMVVDAVRRNRLYVHTDRTMWDPIWARTKALLEAMPANEGPPVAQLPHPQGRRP